MEHPPQLPGISGKGADRVDSGIIARDPAELQAESLIDNTILADFVSFIDAAPATAQTYTNAVKQFYKYLQAEGIERPSREDVKRYRDRLKTYCKNTTVQNYIEALRIFFKWTEQRGLYPNIAEHIKGAKISGEFKKDYLTAKQLKRVLAGADQSTAQGLRDYALMLTMLTGSLRDIEIHRANIEDIGTAAGCTVLYLEGKGRDDKAEYVKLPEETEKAIRAYLKSRRASEPTEPLFVSLSNNSKGKRLSTRSISAIIKSYLVKAGYDSTRYTAHSFRHSGITLSLQGGNTLQEAQLYARHKSINTTLRYAHNLKRAKNKCADTIAAAVLRK